MAHEYLYKEYESCYTQLRFYDERQDNLLKYVATLASSVATAQFAIYKLLGGANGEFYLCQAGLSGVVFISAVLIFLSMVKNRLYFTFAARQLNAIRGFLMATEAAEFKHNQLWTSTNFSAAKLSSVHTFQMVGVSLLSVIFLGSSLYGVNRALCSVGHVGVVLIAVVLVFLVEVICAYQYLKAASRKPADDAVHSKKRQA